MKLSSSGGFEPREVPVSTALPCHRHNVTNFVRGQLLPAEKWIGWPSGVRTPTKRVKVSCATVTPRAKMLRPTEDRRGASEDAGGSGWVAWGRTTDRRINSALLCQLSYYPKDASCPPSPIKPPVACKACGRLGLQAPNATSFDASKWRSGWGSNPRAVG